MSKLSLLALGLASATLAACGAQPNASATKEHWNAINDPSIFDASYVLNLDSLPTSGELKVTPWSDTYWPSYQGGVAARWKADETGFDYALASQTQLAAMSAADVARLSPAEKYDILVSRYEYPLVSYERKRTAPTRPSWEGLCHGWSPAALAYTEPKAVLMTNAQGIQIPFGSSDVKALLTIWLGQFANAKSKMLGARCNADFGSNPGAATSPECRDTNAGAFHIVIANEIGRLGRGFVADVTRDAEVWNQPVHGFTSRIVGMQAPSPGAAAGTVKEAIVETSMLYSVEIEPTWTAVVGTNGQANTQKSYKYTLELDASGNIIGGEWLTDARPDFLWQEETPAFSGYFQKLGDLYNAAASSVGIKDPTVGG